MEMVDGELVFKWKIVNIYYKRIFYAFDTLFGTPIILTLIYSDNHDEIIHLFAKIESARKIVLKEWVFVILFVISFLI